MLAKTDGANIDTEIDIPAALASSLLSYRVKNSCSKLTYVTPGLKINVNKQSMIYTYTVFMANGNVGKKWERGSFIKKNIACQHGQNII